MGLLNHLFGGRKGLAKELIIDADKRMALLTDYHTKDYEKSSLIGRVNTIKEYLVDHPAELSRMLLSIERIVDPELIDIKGEEKLESEIISDLKRLGSWEKRVEFSNLFEFIRTHKNVEEQILNAFNELYQILDSQLHLLHMIRQKISSSFDKKEIRRLLSLLIDSYHSERGISGIFDPNSPNPKYSIYKKVYSLARLILVEEKLTVSELKASSKFSKVMHRETLGEESRSQYAEDCERIFLKLITSAGAPFDDLEEALGALKKIELLIDNDSKFLKMIKMVKPKYSEDKARLVMKNFRKSYVEIKEELGSELYT